MHVLSEARSKHTITPVSCIRVGIENELEARSAAFIVLLRKCVAGTLKSVMASVEPRRRSPRAGRMGPPVGCSGQPDCRGTPQEVLRTVHGSQLPDWTCIPCCFFIILRHVREGSGVQLEIGLIFLNNKRLSRSLRFE